MSWRPHNGHEVRALVEPEPEPTFRCRRCGGPWNGGALLLCAAHEEQALDIRADARGEDGR